jgi:hypothetical protein
MTSINITPALSTSSIIVSSTPVLPTDFADYEDDVNSNWRRIENPRIIKDLNGFIILKLRNYKAIDGLLYKYFNKDFS